MTFKYNNNFVLEINASQPRVPPSSGSTCICLVFLRFCLVHIPTSPNRVIIFLSYIYVDYNLQWPHYDIIVQTKQKLDSLLVDVVSATSQQLRSAITSTLAELALAKGYFWAYAHRWYTLHAGGQEEEGILEGQKLEDIVSGNGYFHSLQVCRFFN